MIYPLSNLLHDHAILMDAVEKSEIPEGLSSRLNGQITFREFSQIFLEVMDEYFKLLFF